MVVMYEDAYKQQPGNEELGSQAFMANVRIGNWKAAQQVRVCHRSDALAVSMRELLNLTRSKIAAKLHKQFHDDHYLYWSVMSAVLQVCTRTLQARSSALSVHIQASDPTTAPGLRPVLYKLAHRLVGSSVNRSLYNADRFYLHLMVLRELELYDEACELLNHDVGKAICAANLSCDELRRDIWLRKGMVKEEGARAQTRLTDARYADRLVNHYHLSDRRLETEIGQSFLRLLTPPSPPWSPCPTKLRRPA